MVPSISICLPYLFLLGKFDCCFHECKLGGKQSFLLSWINTTKCDSFFFYSSQFLSLLGWNLFGISLYFCRRNFTEQKLNSHCESSNQVFRASTNMEGKWKYFEPYHSTISFSLVWSEMLKFYGLWYVRSIWIRFYRWDVCIGMFLTFFVFLLETANLSIVRLETANYDR